MRKALFTLIAAISLLICLTSVLLWVRNYWVTDAISRTVEGGFDIPEVHELSIENRRGTILIINGELINDRLLPSNRDLMPIHWTWERHSPYPTYPDANLLNIVSGSGRVWWQFSLRLLGTMIAFRSEIPYSDGYHERALIIEIPHALIVALTMPLPAMSIYRWRRRRNERPEMKPCAKCGYSLIGNTTGVCPECGSSVEAITSGSNPQQS